MRGGLRGRGAGLGGHDQPLFNSLLLFHPSILEPYLDLGFVQLQGGRYLYPSCSCEVFIEVELFFEFCQLFVSEVRAAGVVEAE